MQITVRGKSGEAGARAALHDAAKGAASCSHTPVAPVWAPSCLHMAQINDLRVEQQGGHEQPHHTGNADTGHGSTTQQGKTWKSKGSYNTQNNRRCTSGTPTSDRRATAHRGRQERVHTWHATSHTPHAPVETPCHRDWPNAA
ncbi:hypothetical protein TRVL_07917 [Trypanosoma vivax]|nr:hypothetical protein TRVL_07917 [Trypanosoma vivax]